jgi:hypothetical protein
LTGQPSQVNGWLAGDHGLAGKGRQRTPLGRRDDQRGASHRRWSTIVLIDGQRHDCRARQQGHHRSGHQQAEPGRP